MRVVMDLPALPARRLQLLQHRRRDGNRSDVGIRRDIPQSLPSSASLGTDPLEAVAAKRGFDRLKCVSVFGLHRRGCDVALASTPVARTSLLPQIQDRVSASTNPASTVL